MGDLFGVAQANSEEDGSVVVHVGADSAKDSATDQSVWNVVWKFPNKPCECCGMVETALGSLCVACRASGAESLAERLTSKYRERFASKYMEMLMDPNKWPMKSFS